MSPNNESMTKKEYDALTEKDIKRILEERDKETRKYKPWQIGHYITGLPERPKLVDKNIKYGRN